MPPPHAKQGINYSWADVQRGSALLSHVMHVLDITSPAALASKQQKQYLAPEAIRRVTCDRGA